jgi:hypothetical protein
VHRKRVIECERLERLERRCRSVSVAAVSAARFKKKFGFWEKLVFTPLCGGGAVLMCNMPPEIFRRFSRFPVLVTQLTLRHQTLQNKVKKTSYRRS